MNIIENKVYDEERSLYNLKNSQVINCTFAGEKDGESVLKEARNIEVINCNFELRYPLWHVDVCPGSRGFHRIGIPDSHCELIQESVTVNKRMIWKLYINI